MHVRRAEHVEGWETFAQVLGSTSGQGARFTYSMRRREAALIAGWD
jgi:hypothetical protein